MNVFTLPTRQVVDTAAVRQAVEQGVRAAINRMSDAQLSGMVKSAAEDFRPELRQAA